MTFEQLYEVMDFVEQLEKIMDTMQLVLQEIIVTYEMLFELLYFQQDDKKLLGHVVGQIEEMQRVVAQQEMQKWYLPLKAK